MLSFLIYLVFAISIISSAEAQKMTVITSPNTLPSTKDNRIKIFLGGSIDMGKAENWQAKLQQELVSKNVILLNPRRDDWNKDWKPISTDPNFRTQVEWELSALEASDIIIIYFAPNSQSPISLLELGLYAKTNKLMVVCPEGFWRKGNVDIVSKRYKIDTYTSLDSMLISLNKKIN